MPQWVGDLYEEIEIYRRANSLCTEAGRVRNSGSRSVPKDGHFRSHVLQLEEEVWRPRRFGTAAPETTGRGEFSPQAHGGRPEPGQANVARGGAKKAVKPARKRELAHFLIQAYRVSIRRATAVLQLRQATYFYHPSPRDDRAERRRIREIAETRIRYGVERIHVLLRRKGWLINHKKTHRIYCEEGLNLRRKRPRRRVAAAHRMERPEVSTVNACWSMDFVADQLFNGQKFRALTVVDNFSRESLAITVDYALKAADGVSTMDHLKTLRGTPKRIQVDNGSEFISHALDHCAYENGVTLDFSRPGKPTDNPFIVGDLTPREFRLAHLEAKNL